MSTAGEYTLVVNGPVSTGTPLTFVPSNPQLHAALLYSQKAVLYVVTHDLDTAPSLSIRIDNVVLDTEIAQIGSKAHTCTEGTLDAFVFGFVPTANEGEYSTDRDFTAPLHPGFKITFTCSGGGASLQVDASMYVLPPGF